MRGALLPNFVALALAGALLSPLPAVAQIAVESADLAPRETPFQGWGVYRQVTVDSGATKLRLTQLSTPVSLKVRLGARASLVLYGAYAKTEVGPDSGGAAKQSLSGMTDARAKLFVHSGGTVLSIGVGLPTGRHALTPIEDFVASVAATDLYGFRVRRMGEGLDAQAGLTHARELGPRGAVALGVAFLYRGSYKPSRGADTKYRPGAEVSASVGYDYSTPSTLLRFNATGRAYTKDQVDGVPVFRQGGAAVFEERWVARSAARLSNDFSMHQVLKAVSDFYGDGAGNPLSTTAENGSSFGAAERLEFNLGGGARLAALAEGTMYGKNDAGFESAHLLSFGGELSYAPSAHALARVMVRALTGAADPGDLKLSGMDISGSLRVVF
ncbi:MAG: hypothetical protein HZB25_02585 [Candidatus Eisenbacteria bacterium]|nr:hypothetical protein [Candidatus Eisenbacteria bacterium]